MKKLLLLPLISLAFWACSDNESNPAKPDVPEPPTSSEEILYSSETTPSSSEVEPSSSSVANVVPESPASSVAALSSSSTLTEVPEPPVSSAAVLSSSSVVTEPPASSETILSSSSTVVNVPKDSSGSFVDARDGRSYRTVKIGEQTWMAENLAYALPGSICRDDNPANCEKYGRLYTWTQAIARPDDECGFGNECYVPREPLQGVCPDGWFLPDSSDWTKLMNFVEANIAGETVVESLMAKDQPEWNEYVTPTDRFGFAALASAGYYDPENVETDSIRTNFWLKWAADEDSRKARTFEISPMYNMASRWTAIKTVYYSVRCIKY